MPGTGSSTPIVSLPGAVELPEIRDDGHAGQDAAVGCVRGADVGVEVVERSLAEEDRVGERAEPGDERRLVPVRVGHLDVQELRLDRVHGRVGAMSKW